MLGRSGSLFPALSHAVSQEDEEDEEDAPWCTLVMFCVWVPFWELLLLP